MPFRKTYTHTSSHKQNVIYRHTYSKAHLEKKNINMIEGPLFGKILMFILPLMITNILQVLYGVADTIIVSFSSEPDAVGAIGITGPISGLIVNLFIGFSTGANVMVAKGLGAKDDANTSRTVHTSLIMSLIFGVICSVIGILACEPILMFMGAKGKLLELSVIYLKIYFSGIPFISLANYLIAIFRAKGDTKTPLVILTLSGILNVILNFVFVFGFNTSVEGVSIATMISNTVSAVFLLVVLSKDPSACRFSLKSLCFDKKAFKNILYVGLPAGIQGCLFSLSNLIIQTSIIHVNNMVCPPGSAFEPVVKGNSSANSLEGFIYQAQNSVYQAAITFTSQNNGAKKYERIPKIMGSCYLLGVLTATVVASIILLLRDPLLSLYSVHRSVEGSLEAIAYDTAMKRMLYIFTSYGIIACMEVGCGVVRGLGKSISSTIISLIGACILRIVWILAVFKANPSLEVIYISYPISWSITALIFLVYTVVTLRPLIKKRKAELLN